MFQLLKDTEAELTTFVGRTQKSGKDDIPAVSFRLKLSGVSNTMLDMLSPTIRSTAYEAVEGQDQLPGVEAATPILRCKDFKHWSPEIVHEGWSVTVAHGIGDDSALQMGSTKVDDFRVDFYEGGRIDIDFRCSTADVDQFGAGQLWARQKRKVHVRVVAPELPPAPIDGTVGHPGAAAAAEGQSSLLDDIADLSPEEALARAAADPDDAGQDDDGSGNPDGDDDAAFEAGAAQAIAAAGVRPGRRARKALQ